MDKIKKGEVTYCPTRNMLGELCMKPQQVSIFKKIQNAILNLPDTKMFYAEHRSVLEKEYKNIKKYNNHQSRKGMETR